MTRSVRRVVLGLVLGGAMVGGAALSTALTSAQECDPSYPGFCLPNLGYNAYNCEDVGDNFTVYPPDVNEFDADYDGIGCESS